MPVEEQNVERLLGKAYRPETPSASFAADVTGRMLDEAAAAAGRGNNLRMEDHMLTSGGNNWRIWIPSAIAAMVMIALGVVAVVAAMRNDDAAVRREGAVVWIDGEAYVPAPASSTGGGADAKQETWTRAPQMDNSSSSSGWFSGLTPKQVAKPPATRPADVGETIVTKEGEKRRVVLADGSVLYLNQNTSVKVEGERRVSVSAGEVYVEVSPRPGGGGAAPTFVVKTPGRELSALGTKFGLEVGDKGTSLLVTQGKVQVSGLEQPVQSGQQLAPEKEHSEKPVTAAPRATHALDWTQELMAAANSPLVPDSEYEGGALIVVDPHGQESRLSLRKYHVDTHVQDGFVRTTIDQTYFNHENRRLEGTFYFPLPADASLSRLAMYVEGKLMEGGMAERDYARDVYESIVYTQRDPALLEWMDGSTFKMRVFPLEARQEKRILISYVQKLPELYGHAEYRFPAGHNLGLVRDWSFHATVKNAAMTHWNCESHQLTATQVNGDLLLDAQAKHVKPDRDIVLKLYDSARASLAEMVRFSSATHEGAKYLMMRYRPNLPSAPVRERRDWVFVFEAAGNRDPLLARAQVDVIKTILENAEHDDTFAIVTAGTRTQAYAKDAQPATPENVREAVAFLERVHLVGALDLSKALAATEPFVTAAQNPYVVHVGTGIASLGERKEDVLAKQVNAKAKYVGIGVGKRWSRAFMKNAASRTGGYFTQINPDEDVNWRALDLLATLNTPRLLDVKVTDPSGRLSFLAFADSAAQGEEITAVARMDANAALPDEVVVSGTLNGKSYTEIKVSDVADRAGYLPRTWAKLEIDRLLAENAEGNKARIIELSKAMYVMSPFTSLLVLENEAMYEQFKVDRGRKDHWALYPAPEKIAVVYEPDANTPARTAPATDPKQPATKRPVEQVLQTVMVRLPSQVLYWPNQQRYYGNQAVTAWQLLSGGAYGEVEEQLVMRGLELDVFDTDMDFLAPADFDVANFTRSNRLNEWSMQLGDRLSASLVSRDRLSRGQGLVRGRGAMHQWAERSELLKERLGRRVLSTSGGIAGAPGMSGPAAPMGFAGAARKPGAFGRFGGYGGGRGGGGMPFGGRGGFARGTTTFGVDAEFAQWSVLAGEPMSRMRRLARFDEAEIESRFVRLGQLKDEAKKERAAFANGVLYGMLSGNARQMLIYQRPNFHGDHRIFGDLLQYAPGMNTTWADVYAVVEAEAAGEPDAALGNIDPRAKELIQRARSSGWRSMTLVGDGAGEASYTITFDGAGRYVCERTVSDGLAERVYCDGQTLHHLYPDLGLGSRRIASRFHRADLAAAVPFVVLPAEDMARGADVVMVGDNVVAIVPRETEAAPTTRPTTRPVRTALHLVFDDQGILSERRVVEVGSNKVLYRQALAADAVRVLDADGKELDKVQVKVEQVAEAPQLNPDTKGLVILPMPYRTRDHVLQTRNIANKGSHEWSHEDVLAVMSADVTQHPHEVQQLAGSRFVAKGDKRIGFYTLMLSANYNWDPKQEHNYGNGLVATFDPVRDHPQSKLAKYIDEQLKFVRQGYQSETQPPAAGNALLDQLSMLRHIWSEYNSGRATRDDPSRKRSAARALAFVKQTKDAEFAWAVLSLIQNYGGEAEFYKAVAEQLKSFEQIAGLSYAARYEYARNLYRSGDQAQAQKLFAQLYNESIDRGALPAVDHDFRNAFSSANAHDEFARMMRDASTRLMDKAGRMSGIYLAWQLQQIGDGALAEELLGAALLDVPQDQRLMTTLAAVDFLWHTGQNARADAMLEPILQEKEFAQYPELWRLAGAVASGRGMLAKALAYQEKALDLEYEQMPAVVNLQAIRQDYGQILGQYEQLANAISTLQHEPPRDFVAKVIRVTDRWRALDPDDTAASQAAARILQRLGAGDMAWDYLTTPLAESANESTPWTNLAATLRQQGDFPLADRAYATAYEIEPTNAQILWDRAQLLQQSQRHADAVKLYRQIADGKWQPRFNWIQQQAKRYVQAN